MGKNRNENRLNRLTQQKGIGLFGAMVVIGIISVFTLLTLAAVPMYSEYLTVKTITENLVATPGLRKKSPRTIKQNIAQEFRQNSLWDLDYEKVLHLKRVSGKGLVLIIDYEARRNLLYNLDLVARFKEEPKLLN